MKPCFKQMQHLKWLLKIFLNNTSVLKQQIKLLFVQFLDILDKSTNTTEEFKAY